MLTTETCSRRSANTKRTTPPSRKRTSGVFSSKWSGVSKPCMTCTLCTGTSKVPMCSSTKTSLPNWATWTSAKSPIKEASTILKRALLTMPVQRSGETSPTILKATFGHWAACCMRWLHWNRHSKQQICRVFTKEWLRGSTQELERIIPTICSWW